MAAAAQGAAPPRHKLVIVVRADVAMTPGKVAAQACHAALKAQRAGYGGSSGGGASLRGTLSAWQAQGEPIVVLRGPGSEAGLLALVAQAKAAGLPAYTVRDAGRTQVEAGTMTVAAIGPAEEGRIDAVTGSLRLY